MCLSPRWGRHLQSSVWKKCFAQSLRQAKLLLVWVLGWHRKGEQCLPGNWGALGLLCQARWFSNSEGEGGRWISPGITVLSFPSLNGRLFQNTLWAGKVFWLFSSNIPSSALPSELRPSERLGSFGGTWWARGAMWAVGPAHGCHWSPWLSLAPSNHSPMSPPGGKKEVLLHVRSLAGPEWLHNLCLFAFAVCCCVCAAQALMAGPSERREGVGREQEGSRAVGAGARGPKPWKPAFVSPSPRALPGAKHYTIQLLSAWKSLRHPIAIIYERKYLMFLWKVGGGSWVYLSSCLELSISCFCSSCPVVPNFFWAAECPCLQSVLQGKSCSDTRLLPTSNSTAFHSVL